MTRLIKIDAALVEAAADEIHELALDIKLSHTIDGEWTADEAEAHKEYDELMALYSKLNEHVA